MLRCGIGMALLAYASYNDLKSRTVKNTVWVVMGGMGALLLLLQLILDGKPSEYYLIFIPIGVFFGAALIEHDPLVDFEKHSLNMKVLLLYALAFIVMFYQIYSYRGDLYLLRLLGIPALLIFFHLLYQSYVIQGGADAKALMAIAILTPAYPKVYNLPLIEIGSEKMMEVLEASFPFALLVLMNSVLFIVWIFLAFFIYNCLKGDSKFPEALLGYRMNIDDVASKNVWPMEKVLDGKRVLVLFPKRSSKEDLEALKRIGAKKVWVTPKIPFMMPLTIGFAISIIFGNFLIAILFWLG